MFSKKYSKNFTLAMYCSSTFKNIIVSPAYCR
jgi:hypothetical protein